MQPLQSDIADTLDPILFRQGMARLASSVTIVTTDGPAGRHGLTATAVCSVTDSPPTLLVCINRSAGAHDALMRNKALCVNVLSEHQQTLSSRFGGSRLPVEERFGLGGWSRLARGAPVLDEAAVSFDGFVTHHVEIGTHTVLFCTVAAMATHGEQPSVLLYADRAYGRVGAALLQGAGA